MDNDDDVLSDAQGLSEKVFDGCPISCQTSIVLVMSLISHHKLTKRAAQDLIQLLLCHFPRDHRSYTSLYTLKRRFASLIGKTSKGRQVSYCTYCHSLLNGQDSCTTCTNDENASVGEYTELDIKQQIQQLFKDKNFVSHLNDRFKVASTEQVSDICSGKEYQKHVGIGGVLQSTYNISLTLNTDGISMFKSSAKCSLWPLYLVINELPPQMRFCPKFMILAAVWCQHEKPDVYVY